MGCVRGLPPPQALKFEVVSEGRVDLQGVEDESLPVARLADADMVAEKLLANADRFLDDSALARDVIDLILLENALGGLPKAAWAKARAAYGTAIDDAYRRALEHLRDEPTWRKKATDTLSVTSEAIATIEAKLGALAPVVCKNSSHHVTQPRDGKN